MHHTAFVVLFICIYLLIGHEHNNILQNIYLITLVTLSVWHKYKRGVCVLPTHTHTHAHTRFDDILAAKCVRWRPSSVRVIDCTSCWPNVSGFSPELGEKSVISSKAPFEKPHKPVIAREKAGRPAKPNTSEGIGNIVNSRVTHSAVETETNGAAEGFWCVSVRECVCWWCRCVLSSRTCLTCTDNDNTFFTSPYLRKPPWWRAFKVEATPPPGKPSTTLKKEEKKKTPDALFLFFFLKFLHWSCQLSAALRLLLLLFPLPHPHAEQWTCFMIASNLFYVLTQYFSCAVRKKRGIIFLARPRFPVLMTRAALSWSSSH